YELGYGLDNLSLMALTIAVGFVVDDAVVVIENVHRYLEEGLSPMEAALKGAGEIGFTIVSITLSLIAVFIPLFLMSGYVGLLFREFAVTVSVSLVLSLIIALTLTPMMCARLLRAEDPARHGRLYRLFEAGFDGLLGGYERSLKIALRHRFMTLLVMLGTIGVTGYLYVIIPKGFFPQQDTGMIIAIAEAAQDITIGARVSRTQYQYSLVDADAGELNHWAPLFLDKIKGVPGITDVASDQANAGPLLDIAVNRDAASRYGILPQTIDNTLGDAFGQRIVSTMFLPLNQYHVVLEVEPQFQTNPQVLSQIYVNSPSG